MAGAGTARAPLRTERTLHGGLSMPCDNPELAARFSSVRRTTEALCAHLSAEDCAAQSMPDASPAKWHLAHTSWFFDTFVISGDGTPALGPKYAALFNSYYDALGARVERRARGLLTRPGLGEVQEYRRAVTDSVLRLLDGPRGAANSALCSLVTLGINHEEQHQELLLTDIKHLFSCNPLLPAYRAAPRGVSRATSAARGTSFREYAGGVVEIGAVPGTFSFDNEGPRHRVLLEPFALADRLVTNSEYLEFIRDGGYERPELWLSDGFRFRVAQLIATPLYWRITGDRITGDDVTVFGLDGETALALDEPVCHVSYYEADAFARWAGARLPSEAEWEHVADQHALGGNFLESERLRPCRAGPDQTQLFGDVWEWTASAYAAYPGYRPPAGALGEYNAKFMCNQMVLRGGSCVTPGAHLRASYRNFFPPEARWQFSGIRLCRSPE